MYRSLEEIIHRIHEAETKTAKGQPGLSLQEVEIIDFIARNESCIMREVADYLHISVSHVTGLIDKLESKKLVARKRSLEDRRIVNLHLIAKGRRTYEANMKKVESLFRKALSKMTKKEQKTFLELSRKFVEGAKEVDETES